MRDNERDKIQNHPKDRYHQGRKRRLGDRTKRSQLERRRAEVRHPALERRPHEDGKGHNAHADGSHEPDASTEGGIKMKKNPGRKALRDRQRKERKEAGRKKMKLHNALQQEHKLHLL